MDKTDFCRDARLDLPGPLAGLRVLEACTTWAETDQRRPKSVGRMAIAYD